VRQLSVVENSSSPGFQYDVYVAHSSRDADAVQRLRAHLRTFGFTTWSYDDVRPGEPIYLSVCAAMCRSRRCVLFVTQSFVNSKFFDVQLNNALDRQCRLGIVFCLPVYHQLDANSRPYQLSNMRCFDHHSDDFWPQLESAIRSKVDTVPSPTSHDETMRTF